MSCDDGEVDTGQDSKHKQAVKEKMWAIGDESMSFSKEFHFRVGVNDINTTSTANLRRVFV